MFCFCLRDRLEDLVWPDSTHGAVGQMRGKLRDFNNNSRSKKTKTLRPPYNLPKNIILPLNIISLMENLEKLKWAHPLTSC